MYYRHQIENCLNDSGVAGVSSPELQLYLSQLDFFLDELRSSYENNKLPILRIGERQDDLNEALNTFAPFLNHTKHLVVLGTGGSSLGGKALVETSQPALCSIHFLPNLDPSNLSSTFESIDLEETTVLCISKSGNTPETLAQTIITLDIFKKAGLEAKIKDHFICITEPEDGAKFNGLAEICQKHDIQCIEHDPGIGGRYSVFTPVGMLPALASGLDPFALREGANSVIENMLTAKSATDCAPAVGAAITYGMLNSRNIRSSILMPYSDKLSSFTGWFAQLWAESLGKDGSGTIPVPAIGPVDQHSMLQLFLDGPSMFLMNLVMVKNPESGPVISEELAHLCQADFLGGRTVQELINAQQYAIRDSFVKTCRPVRVFEIDNVNEHTMGALMMHFMLETIFTARLLKIDPFDQPAVELGKVLTRQYLTKHDELDEQQVPKVKLAV